MNEESLPLVQEDPEFNEYCQVAFVSTPVTLIAPFVVMPSELDDPVSLAIDKIGEDAAILSVPLHTIVVSIFLTIPVL